MTKNIRGLKTMAMLIVLIMLSAFIPVLTVNAAYENTHVNTGNQADDIASVAETQVGYHEGANNETKYNHWFGRLSGFPADGYGYAWCQTFVAWCANQANIETSKIAKVSGTVSGMDSFKKNNTWHNGPGSGEAYTPKRGDIIYFRSSGSNSGYHVGIVTGCDGSTVYTVEGNSSDMVAKRSYAVSNSKIYGYGVPNYAKPNTPLSNFHINTDKTQYKIGEAVVFSFSSSGASELYIPIDFNGKRSDFIDVTGKDTYSCVFDKAGTYGYFLYGKNSDGEMSTVDDYRQFTIYDSEPTDLSLKTNKKSYMVGEIVEFSFNSKNASELYIPIDYNGKRSDFIDVTGKESYSCSFEAPGIYGVFLYGKNPCGEVSTVNDYFEFEVYDSIPSGLKLSVDKTEYNVGEKVKFSFTANHATELYIPVDVNNKRAHFIDVSGKTKYECSFDVPGIYGVFLYGKNQFGESSTVKDYLTFKVYSNIKGDANNDGKVTTADLVTLQKWLLGASDKLESWQNTDLNGDGIIDAFDMVMLRKIVIENSK